MVSNGRHWLVRQAPRGLEMARGWEDSGLAVAPAPKPGSVRWSVLGTCFTKQTGDMVYTMAENSWLSQLWLDA